jgi:Ca2+-binding RTX toxin-like protein
MLVSKFVDGVSAEFSLVRNGDQLTATFYYGLTGFEDENGIFLWDGEIGASIGAYSDYFHQTADRPMDLQFVATLAPGANTAASYFVNDNIGGAAFDHEFNVVIFTTAANFLGSSQADLVFGSAGADVFRSNGVGDMFEGGAGNDIYRIYSVDTKVFEVAGGGSDRIAAGVSYVLATGVAVEQLTTNGSTGTAKINLTGNTLAQTIAGNAGDNVLRDGGGAGDVLVGLGGNDTYQIYSTATTIQEGVGEGNADRVMTGVNYTLAAGVDVEIMTTNGSAGTTAINLRGNALSQTIVGNDGNNDLHDGGAGAADILQGRDGDDVYRIYNTNDVVIERAGEGKDTVVTRESFTLAEGVEVERLVTYSVNGTANIDLTGNEFCTVITGNKGDNVLNDGGGTAVLTGGGGQDIYIINNSNSKVITTFYDGVYDYVHTGVSYVLPVGGGAGGISVLRAIDESGVEPINLTGNSDWQFIYGNNGDNRLDGGGDARSGYYDTIKGGGGKDTFVISRVLITVVGNDNPHFVDFTSADDTIELRASVFDDLPSVGGVLAASAFQVFTPGPGKHFDAPIVYEAESGYVFFEYAEGKWTGIAKLPTGISLTNADFTIA